MSYFSALFQGGTVFYGDAFPPIIDYISDWGWSILSQPGQGQGGGRVQEPTGPADEPDLVPPIDFGIPTLPVEIEPWSIEGSPAVLHSVLPRSVSGPAQPEILRPTVVVDEYGNRIEEYEEGDFLEGSIFAPGQPWGGTGDFEGGHGLDEDVQEEEMAAHDWGSWLRTTLTNLGGYGPGAGDTFGGQQFVESSPRPSGSAALPPSAAPLINQNGCDPCGNRRYVTLDRQTGKMSCRRRRRRRLLTARDLGDLAALKAITGNNDALKMAVIKAVR